MSMTPTGHVFASPCQRVSPAGLVAWSEALPCYGVAGDEAGNTYLQLNDANTGRPIVQSRDPAGAPRWTVPADDFSVWRGAEPVLGADGRVYFVGTNGYSSSVRGFDAHTGAATPNLASGDITGLYAYPGGLIVVSGIDTVVYLRYDGTVANTYRVPSGITAYEAFSNAVGADGSVFLAGYTGSCSTTPQARVSVAKFTPSGRAWTWTETEDHFCTQTYFSE